MTSSLDAGGLRPARLQRDRPGHRRAPGSGQRTDALQQRVAALNREVDAPRQGRRRRRRSATCSARSTRCAGPPGFEEVHGPALTVVLSDAPKEEIDRAVENGEVTADQLVVHQQDIQAVVNALWAGGAEAMTLQKQRVISTTGIKCVGNTVVLHGVPYAPPYEITAIGDLDALHDGAGLQRLHRRLQDLRRRVQPRLRGEHRRRRHDAGVRRQQRPALRRGRPTSSDRRPGLSRLRGSASADWPTATATASARSAASASAPRRSRPRSSPCCPCRASDRRSGSAGARCPSWPRSWSR